MFLSILFILISIVCGLSFVFGERRFSLSPLLLFVWFLSIGLAQLRLSPYEHQWPAQFWLIILSFLALFILAWLWSDLFWSKKITLRETDWQLSGRLFGLVIFILAVASLASNAYIFWKLGTMPILSSSPDRTRFIINEEIFGLWEYVALLPRIFIPLAFAYILLAPARIRSKVFAGLAIILGFAILSLYSSRLVIIFPVVLSYLIYLIIKIRTIDFKRVMATTILAVVVILSVSVAIPAFRHFITYRDIYRNKKYDAFSYIIDLSELKIPQSLRFTATLYIAPTFNLQAFYRVSEYYQPTDFYYGRYHLSVIDSLTSRLGWPLAVKIPWKEVFLPWWITATFLAPVWIDFGYPGVMTLALLWAFVLSGLYWKTKNNPNLVSVLLYAYVGFVSVMSIYDSYFLREEFYIDVLFFVIVGFAIASIKRK